MPAVSAGGTTYKASQRFFGTATRKSILLFNRKRHVCQPRECTVGMLLFGNTCLPLFSRFRFADTPLRTNSLEKHHSNQCSTIWLSSLGENKLRPENGVPVHVATRGLFAGSQRNGRRGQVRADVPRRSGTIGMERPQMHGVACSGDLGTWNGSRLVNGSAEDSAMRVFHGELGVGASLSKCLLTE